MDSTNVMPQRFSEFTTAAAVEVERACRSCRWPRTVAARGAVPAVDVHRFHVRLQSGHQWSKRSVTWLMTAITRW
jgi:hypothetical protein